MNRLSLDEQQVQAMRAAVVSIYASIPGTWEPEDDPNRTGDVCPGSVLKVDDDVLARDGNAYRVLSPAPGRDRFTAWGMTDWGMTTTSLALSDVTDRAPADPNEIPMPILAEQPPESP